MLLYSNTAFCYSSFGSLRIPNRQRKIPLSIFGLLTTTTRIPIPPLFVIGHRVRTEPERYPKWQSPIWSETQNRLTDQYQTIQKKPASRCDRGDTFSWCLLLYASSLCLIPRYAKSSIRCQSFEKYSINKPLLKERQASSPIHSLLTHNGS